MKIGTKQIFHLVVVFKCLANDKKAQHLYETHPLFSLSKMTQ